MTDLYAEALSTFAQLFEEAQAAGEPEPTAMTVATASLDARPSARTVLLKAHDARGFVFYTHLDSRKGRELQANPHAALLFHWKRVRERRAGAHRRPRRDRRRRRGRRLLRHAPARQPARRLGVAAVRDAGLARDLRARASPRSSASSPVATCRVRRAGRGLRVRPERIEFWYGADFRLHERWLLRSATATGDWRKRMLYP